MRHERRELSCIARGHGDQWEAFCLDYDLAVQARSFDEARQVLSEVIATYVDDAMKEDEPARTRLLNRRAPLAVRLLWAWRTFRSILAGAHGHGDPAIGFPVACPGTTKPIGGGAHVDSSSTLVNLNSYTSTSTGSSFTGLCLRASSCAGRP